MKIFEYNRTCGDILSENYNDRSFTFDYVSNDLKRVLTVYSLDDVPQKRNELYLGHTMEEVLDAGTDILGNELIKNGCPNYESIKGVLPEITDGAYCFLSGAASHGGVVVDRYGNIAPQLCEMSADADPLFNPASCDASLTDIIPSQYFLDGRFPILFNVFKSPENVTELMYFVDSGDSDRDPVVWIREKKFSPEAHEHFTLRYGVREISHGYAKKSGEIYEVPEDVFNDTLGHTINHWLKFTDSGSRLNLPNEELVKVSEGSMISAATTFTGPRPHYGHKYYGKELHDNFPPNYIWAIEAAFLTGHDRWAREIFEHLINYGLTDEGKFCYRQGPFISGASATEYGMILWLAKRYENKIFRNGIDEETAKKLCRMGNIIISKLIPCPEFDGLELIKMCAEADNNVRVNVYLNNNLWSIRGLYALAELLHDPQSIKYRESADKIKLNINILLEKYTLKGTEFGDVPPFRFNYPQIPYTLSNCKTHLLPNDEDELKRYFYKPEGRRDFDTTDQEITENTYANYRYYPEALSAMLLPENLADGIFNMRENLGGNILGMTRFRSWIDNWPVVNYARYLIETQKTEQYLLLLYSHTQHHGHPNLMCYYEQIKLYGKVSAHDCVPSLLTTPIMTSWMFAYETVDNSTLRLLSAVPGDWFEKSFSAKRIGTLRGYVNLSYEDKVLTIDFSLPTEKETEVYFNNIKTLSIDNILEGRENITRISGNKVMLREGISCAKIRLK